MMSPGNSNDDDFPSRRMMRESHSKGPSSYMRIVTRRYELPDGRITDWDLVDGGKTVAVLASCN
jgi:hypothetical protein